MKITRTLLAFFLFVILQTSFAAQSNYTILFTGKLNKKMVILDLQNERKIVGNRENLRKLLKNKNFRKSLRRDVGMEPDVLKASLLKNKNIGKNSAISKRLFNKIKDNKLFKKREFLRSQLAALRKKKTCASIVTAVILAAEFNSDVEVAFDNGDINRQIKNDERDELNEKIGNAVSDMQKLNIEKQGCIPGEGLNKPIVANEEIEVNCSKYDDKTKEELKNESDYRKVALELLPQREAKLKETLPDPLLEDYDIKVAFLLNQVKNIKTFLKKDEVGCFNPYDGFEDIILFSKEPAAKKADKRKAMPKDCKPEQTVFGVKYGKGCYPQRVSCMDKKQNENFEKLNDTFEFEKPEDNAFLIKFPIYNSDTGKIEENYSYEKGNYYNIQGVNQLDKTYEVRKTNANGDLYKGEQKTPEYFMKDSDGKYSRLNLDHNVDLIGKGFRKPKYPFFRPTDQCSISMQGAGGVCFQEACKQHDLCFQTLPDTKTTSFDQHFNKCNNRFERNIGRLCDQNEKDSLFGWTKNMYCHTVKKVFYGAVQWLEGAVLMKGRSFKESQRDQYQYLASFFIGIYNEKCSGIDWGENEKMCLMIVSKIEKLKSIRKGKRRRW